MNRYFPTVTWAPLGFAWVAFAVGGLCHAQERSNGGNAISMQKIEPATSRPNAELVEEQKAELRATIRQVSDVQHVELGAVGKAGNAVVIQAGPGLQAVSGAVRAQSGPVENQSPQGTNDEGKQKFMEGLVEARRTAYEMEMKDSVAALVAALQLDEVTAEKLIEGIDDAVDASMEGWSGKVVDAFQGLVTRLGGNEANVLRTSPSRLLRFVVINGAVPPKEQNIWKEHLEQMLSEGSFLAWQEWTAKQQNELEIRIAEWLEAVRATRRTQLERQMEPLIADLIQTLGLAPNRVEQLKKIATLWVDEVIESVASAENEMVRQLDKATQEQTFLRRGLTSMSALPKPEEHAKWKESVAAFLTADEEHLLSARREQRFQRQIEAVKQAVLMTLDKRLLLTAKQVAVLATSIDPAATTTAQSMKGTFNMDHVMVGRCLSAAAIEDFQETLDASQLAMFNGIVADRNGVIGSQPLSEEEKGSLTESNEALHERIGDIIRGHYHQNLTRLQVELDCQVAEMERVLGLSREERETLRLAAVGVAQDALQTQRQQIAASAYNAMWTASPEQIPQRLAGLVRFGNSRQISLTQSPFWDQAVSAILNPERLMLLEKEKLARELRVRDAQTQLVLFEADRLMNLSDRQYGLLADRLGPILKEYGSSLDVTMNQQSREWSVNSRTMLLPLLAIPSDDLRQMFNERQQTLLEGQLAGFRSFWPQLKRSRDLRTR